MSIKIVYRGFADGTSSVDAIGILTRLFKGDRAKAEDVFMSPGHVLQTVETEAEIQLVLPRLEKLGLRCEVVNEMPAEEPATLRDPSVVIRFVTCPACGQKQMPADACRGCGESFLVKRDAAKPADDSAAARPSASHVDERDTAKAGFLAGLLGGGGIAVPSLGAMLGIVAVAGGVFVGKDLFVSENGKPSAACSNSIMMIICGIMTSDAKEVAKTMNYDPESGTNPYAERLKSLGIDPKEFAKAQGIEGGEMDAAKINELIEKNPMMKKAIEDATASSKHSQGTTETDDKIRSATGE